MDKGSIDRRLARIEGQIRGLRRMAAENEYCNDILNQLNAVKSALDQVGAQLVSSHIETCILGHDTGTAHESAQKMSVDELMEELRETLSRLMR